jgi:hypothetical protein
LKPFTNGPRVLFYDEETTHNIVAAFNLYGKDYLPHDNILQERYIVCASWKWWHQDKIHSVSVLDDRKRYKANPHDDYFVVDKLSKAIEESDIIVAHNGDQYDYKFLTARRMAHKLKPLSPTKSIDTYKIAKSKFLFNSNRLDYLGAFLGLGRKRKTSPGLWLRVLAGDPQAVKEMVDYNKGDVELLEDIFEYFLPYVPSLNQRLYGKNSGCVYCGSTHVQRRGTHVAETRTYQRFQCQACGGWFREGKPELSVSARGL